MMTLLLLREEAQHLAQARCRAVQEADSKIHNGVVVDRFNDPSAGSPTETLLRLLLPLGGRV
jgi:hypothetical protein